MDGRGFAWFDNPGSASRGDQQGIVVNGDIDGVSAHLKVGKCSFSHASYNWKVHLMGKTALGDGHTHLRDVQAMGQGRFQIDPHGHFSVGFRLGAVFTSE